MPHGVVSGYVPCSSVSLQPIFTVQNPRTNCLYFYVDFRLCVFFHHVRANDSRSPTFWCYFFVHEISAFLYLDFPFCELFFRDRIVYLATFLAKVVRDSDHDRVRAGSGKRGTGLQDGHISGSTLLPIKPKTSLHPLNRHEEARPPQMQQGFCSAVEGSLTNHRRLRCGMITG